MPSRTISINKGLVFYILRSSGWIGFLYFIGLIFALPLEILKVVLNKKSEYMNFVNLFSSQQMIQFVLTISIPVLLAIFLFRFLQVKQASDFIHSLPITRRSVYFHMIGTGLALIILPIVLTGLMLFFFQSALDVETLYTSADIWSWMGITFFMETLFFSVSVLVGMVTGLSALQCLLTYIVLALPAGLFILFVANAKIFLVGFFSDYYLNTNMVSISPLMAATVMEKMNFFSVELLINAIISCLMLWISLVLYKCRRVENVSQAFVFPKIKPVFKYGLTMCMMLFGGFYFSQTTGEIGWIIFGYAVGSIIGYYLGDIVLQKTWRIRVSIKGYAIFTTVIMVLIVLLKLDLLSYGEKVPDEKLVNRVYIGNYSPLYYGDGELEEGPSYLQEKENIEAVRLLHQQILEKGKMVTVDDSSLDNSVFFIYELENGKRIAREYQLQNYDAYLPLLAQIYESSEYKHSVNELLNVSFEEVSKIKINASGELDKSVTITDKQQLLNAVQALSIDLSNQTLAQMTKSWGEYAYIEILLESNKTIYMNWNSSYPAFTNWMEQTGLANEARLTADDISSIFVTKFDSQLVNLPKDEIEQRMEKQTNHLRLNQPAEIEAAIENSHADYWDGDYSAVFYYKDSNEFEIRTFSGEYIPASILDYFNDRSDGNE